MHLIFERPDGRLQSNCNILALAWMPYYAETKFRQALLDYHQKQLINLTHPASGTNQAQAINGNDRKFLNSRLAELHQRFTYSRHKNARKTSHSGHSMSSELDSRYGRMPEFGWLVIGNAGKIVGVTLTSTIQPPKEIDGRRSKLDRRRQQHQIDQDLMLFNDTDCNNNDITNDDNQVHGETTQRQQQQQQQQNGGNVQYSPEFELLRPDKRSIRSNYNLRGHLDEIILVRWNELYQKLATIDSRGNVLIWCKINDKFTIQTPFYNRTKSVADFRWSNDGKTALICYTDSFILIGSSSGQRHWHSMLNLDDYHITCASWTPTDDQLLLGVSNGNIVVIDLPRSELTELVVSQVNIRTLCWSSYEMNLYNVNKLSHHQQLNDSRRCSGGSSYRRNSTSTVVNHRRLSRDCSVFSRYRFCSQAPNNTGTTATNSSQDNQTDDSSSTNGRMDYQQQQQQQQVGSDKIHEEASNVEPSTDKNSEQENILAIDFANNTIKLYYGGLEDPEPRSIQVNLESYIMAWSSDGKILAVAGFNIYTSAPTIGCLRCRYSNAIKFYDQRGELIYQYDMKYLRYPITACTWAHNDQRLFVATGPRLHCAKVFHGIAPLSLLALACIHRHTRLADKTDVLEGLLKGHFGWNVLNWQSFNCPIDLESHRALSGANQQTVAISDPNRRPSIESNNGDSSSGTSSSSSEQEQPMTISNNVNVLRYELPLKLRVKIDELFTKTIRQPMDEQFTLNDLAWHVPKNQQRYYCTLICYTSDPMDKDTSSIGHQYRAALMDKSAGDLNSPSDHYKIFVLYAEFQGSLIPILRARRVGFLKPEFVIFDPEDYNGRSLRRQHKVSDVSNYHLYLNDFMSRLSSQQQQPLGVGVGFGGHINDGATSCSPGDCSLAATGGFAKNCADLHGPTSTNQSSSDGQPMTSSGSFGRHSLDDAEHYYNFDQCDTNNRHQQHLDRLAAINNSSANYCYTPTTRATATTKSSNGTAVRGPTLNNSNNSRSNVESSSLLYLLHLSQLKSMQRHQQAKASTSLVPIEHRYRSAAKCPAAPSAAASAAPAGPATALAMNSNGRYLPETNELVRVRSNIWGTKFKLINVGNRMIRQRAVLGSVTYKASILHLQPRQIFLDIKDMTNYCVLCSSHHHTKTASRHHDKRRSIGSSSSSRTTKRAPAEMSTNNSNKTNTEISLIDMPNVEAKLLTPLRSSRRHSSSNSPSRSNNSRKSSSNHQRANESQKVVLAVGDGIRIAPKLERNQKYKFAGSNAFPNGASLSSSTSSPLATNILDNQRPSTSKGHFGTSPLNHCSSTKHSFKSKIQFKTKPTKTPNTQTPSTSNTQQQQQHNAYHQLYSSQTMHSKQSSDSPSTGHQHQADDILTLSLDQGDQVRVEMSSISSQAGPASSATNQNQLDDFLEVNKTLKSIQTITKMIVDLSSKVNDDDDEDANDSASHDRGLLSPTKMLKLSNEGSSPVTGARPSASKYIPPETPVHRPRKHHNHHLSHLYTQSANTTPTISMPSRRHRRSHKTTNGRALEQTTSAGCGPSNPLPPPPPPSMPLSRRISSSAKRFIDGSLRSLYGGSGYSTCDDLEPEECEPLVSSSIGRSSSSMGRARARLDHSNTRNQSRHKPKSFGFSQPSSPMSTKTLNWAPSGASRKDSTDPNSFRDQLMHKLRNITTNWRSADGQADGPSDGYSTRKAGESGLRISKEGPQRGWMSRASSCDRGHHSILKTPNKSLVAKPGAPKTSSSFMPSSSSSNSSSSLTLSSSSPSSSPSSSSSLDYGLDSLDTISGERHRPRHRPADLCLPGEQAAKKNKLGRACSAKELDRLRRLPVDSHKGHSGSKRGLAESHNKTDNGHQHHHHHNHRRRRHHHHHDHHHHRQHSNKRRKRRKSICQNSSCCCGREFKLNNRPPVWNELSQVYQLDFGGRVTQESAKNLQIDFEGNLALQFGRIDRCTYTLDYKYPFNAVQAMAIALASLTQRLK